MYEDEKEISELTKEELLDPGFIPSIYENYPHPDEREECLQQIIGVAKGLKIVTAVKKAIQKCDRDVKTTQMADDLLLMMTVDGKGKTEATVDNYENAILNIKDFEGKIKFNEFTGKFERVMPDGSLKNWNDDDDAWVMKIIERECKIYDPRKFAQGMLSCKKVFGYHPIKDLIEEKEWDGVPRIDHFLADIMKCDDDDYSREVSRMIFYGGISRLYNPGCKFDYMPILIGEQGSGKSSIVSWLSMNTNSYREVLTIEGKEGAELLRNAWLCEFSELLAMVRSREVESMKAYITREIDTFRPAYGKHVIDVPRHCIFIGTTNNYEFLIDKTGNRRYLPIEVHTEKGEIFKHEEAIKKCVLECWREAKYLMDNGEIYLTIPNKYDDIIEQHRLQATEDDPQEGLIAQYLADKPDGAKVCGLEIHTEVFKDLAKNYRSVQARNISNLMRRFPEWVKSKTSARLENYGTQRYWTKVSEKKEDEEKI